MSKAQMNKDVKALKAEEKVLKKKEKKEPPGRRKRRAKNYKESTLASIAIPTGGAYRSDSVLSKQAYFNQVAKTGKASWLEKRTYKYLAGLYNPSLLNMPGPLFGLAPGVNTQIYTYEYSFEIVSNASGFCCVLMDMDGWQTDTVNIANYRGPFNTGKQFLGTTANGNMCWGTTAAYVGTSVPGVGIAPGGLAGYQPFGPWTTTNNVAAFVPGVGASSRYRFISGSMSIDPTSSIFTAQGSIMAWRMRNVDNVALAGGGITIPANSTFAQLSGTVDSIADVDIVSIAEWKRGSTMQLLCLPSTMVSQTFCLVPGSGTSLSPQGHIAFIGSGMATNQAIRVNVRLNYEFTAVANYMAVSASSQEGDQVVGGNMNVSQALIAKHAPSAITAAGTGQGSAVNHVAPAKAMLEAKSLNEPLMSKPEATSWVKDVSSGVESGVKAASAIGDILSVIEGVAALF